MKNIISVFILCLISISSFCQTDTSNKSFNKPEIMIQFGLHAFMPNYEDIFIPKICFQEMIGGELVFSNISLSIEFRRYYWFSLNGGNTFSDINGLSRLDHIGLKKTLPILNNNVCIGVSHAWVSDLKFTQMIQDTISGKTYYYPFRAISPYLAYSIKNFDIELRAYFFYNKNAYTEEYNKFDQSQINLGFVYRWQPEKK
jgi:hypothetical protein